MARVAVPVHNLARNSAPERRYCNVTSRNKLHKRSCYCRLCENVLANVQNAIAALKRERMRADVKETGIIWHGRERKTRTGSDVGYRPNEIAIEPRLSVLPLYEPLSTMSMSFTDAVVIGR